MSRRGPFLVVDFDGTACRQDVGDSFFERFTPPEHQAEWAGLIEAYDSGRMGSQECLTRECALVRVSEADAREFAAGFSLEPGFAELWAASREADLPMVVVSDGLDVYIRHILERHGLGEIPVRANRAVFRGDVLVPEFPWQGLGCGRCGNCKGHHVSAARQQYDSVWMVGDAHSDVCGALVADRVFARPVLQGLLAERGRACEPFDAFQAILDALAATLPR